MNSKSSQAVAKEGDRVIGTDTHVVLVPGPAGAVPTPLPTPFAGRLVTALSHSVFVDGKAAAIAGSTAKNEPAHAPMGGPFQKEPSNEGTTREPTTRSLFIDGKAAARNGDPAVTCSDPADAPNATVVASGTVFSG